VTDLEDVVRQSLRDQVRRQPPMTEPAGRALVGAAAVRRRQSMFAVGAVVVALIGATAGVAALRDGSSAPSLPSATVRPAQSPTAAGQSTAPSTAPSLPTLGLSALVDNRQQLLLPDGRLVSLAGVEGGALQGYQTRDGWLLTGYGSAAEDSAALWLFQSDGTGRRLVDRVSGIVVAPDGRRLAWRSNGKLVVAHIDAAGTVVTDATTQAPQRGAPLAFAGGAVLLGYSATGGGIDNFDVWIPQRGGYTPSWQPAQVNGIAGVFGATSDGRWLIGQVLSGNGSKDSCLAQLDPLDSLRVVARACGLPGAGEFGSVSSDGHWLAYQSGTGVGGQTVLVDLSTVFQQPKPVGTWPISRLGIWTNSNTMVAQAQDERIYRYRVGQSKGEQVNVIGMPPGGEITLVPKLS
jgi:hypothetical protein